MAAAMANAFETADRRKRIATYGKSSRVTPAFNWGDDAPSPERTHKHPSLGGSTTQETSAVPGKPKLQKVVQNSVRKLPSARDATDDLRANGSLSAPFSSGKVGRKSEHSDDVFDVPSSGDESSLPQNKRGKALQPLRTKQVGRSVPGSPKTVNMLGEGILKSDSTTQTSSGRPKISQALRTTGSTTRDHDRSGKTQPVKSKSTSRATTPSVPPHKSTKEASSQPKSKALNNTPTEIDVFDVPSENDAPIQTVRSSRTKMLPRKESKVTAGSSTSIKTQAKPNDSDDSNPEKKRKRGPANDAKVGAPGMTSGVADVAIAPRHRKSQKKTGDKSPRQGFEESMTLPVVSSEVPKVQPSYPARRIRARNNATAPKSLTARMQSSPARLHEMVSVRGPKPGTNSITSQNKSHEEEVTMYDIQDATSTPARVNRSNQLNTTTPQQTQTLSNLMDAEETTTPSMPSIRRLQLTDSKPKSLLGSLVRSSSDIPLSAHSRKPRLIDSLRQAIPSSEGEESDSEDDDESSEEATRHLASGTSTTQPGSKFGGPPVGGRDWDMDEGMNGEAHINSQRSQTSVHIPTSSKVTYAKQRSYREEASLEDGLLLSMDLDDPMGFDGFGAARPLADESEEEEEQGQVRGIHELRKKGQNQKFLNEAESAIDDISASNTLGTSMRRSAMLELCTRMSDESFLEQMLDAGLGRRFMENVKSNGEIVFDFAATTAVAFLLSHSLGAALLDDIYKSQVIKTITTLLGRHDDIGRIAKERKTNLSRTGRESVDAFRTLVQRSPLWSTKAPEKISPRIVGMRTLELLVLALRKSGNTDALVNEDLIGELLDIATQRVQVPLVEKMDAQELLTCNLAFSIMEAVSLSKDKQATWSNKIMRRLAELIPVFLNANGEWPVKLAMRLCMNLTNNRPKACEVFAGPEFVRPLTQSIIDKFSALEGDCPEEQREEVLEELILSLGAMLNLAEFSDRARQGVVADGDELVDALAKLFLEGSERAAQAESMEASHANVTVGYLTVLLGNLCLNDHVRYKMRLRLPGQTVDLLVEKIKEFVRYNERVDRENNDFGGEEGRATWQNFTKRLLLVVERLEVAESG